MGGGPPARSPHTSLRLGVIDLEARPGPAAPRVRRSLAPSSRWPGCLKPLSPLLAGACVGLKPPSPLRMRNRCFWRSFWVQWCCWFQRRHVSESCARCLSPYLARRCVRERETVRPANPKWAKNAVFGRAGRVFRGNAAGGGAPGEFFADQQSWDFTGRVLMQRGPGRWAPLAVLTLQCAATPTW